MKSAILLCSMLCVTVLIGSIKSYSKPCATTTSLTNASKASMQSLTGFATWYCRASAKREHTGGPLILMANGKPLNDKALTMAMWTPGKKLGRFYRVTNLQNGISAIIQQTDLGPGRQSRSRKVICDLSKAAMLALAGQDGIKRGKIKVKIERI